MTDPAETDIIKHLKEAVEKNPDDIQAHLNLGHACLKGLNGADALEAFQKAIRLQSDNAEAYFGLAKAFDALQRYQEMLDAFKEACWLKPEWPEAHYNLGVIMIETRKFDDPELFKKALAHFDIVLQDLPNQPAINWYRGLALWYLDRKQETDAAWTLASQNMEPGSKDAEFVKDALVKLRAGEVPF